MSEIKSFDENKNSILEKYLEEETGVSALKGYHFIVIKFKISSVKLIEYLIDKETGIFIHEVIFLQ